MTTPAPDFRALCAELGALMIDLASTHPNLSENGVRVVNELSDRADAALATPPPEPPTDEELNALWNCCGDYDEEGDHYGNIFQFARAAIKRWGAK